MGSVLTFSPYHERNKSMNKFLKYILLLTAIVITLFAIPPINGIAFELTSSLFGLLNIILYILLIVLIIMEGKFAHSASLSCDNGTKKVLILRSMLALLIITVSFIPWEYAAAFFLCCIFTASSFIVRIIISLKHI
ncbi:MAG: hypothetical protein RRZ73_00405 [Oscillospiraceae bacterium]